ncbi:MAG TPA: asparagine synthase-related protein [Candidatus Sulfotelmatobacter sp.]|nr:asparagine synthase-related protein [Candidatus Sulfotelmatobacter sp.]
MRLGTGPTGVWCLAAYAELFVDRSPTRGGSGRQSGANCPTPFSHATATRGRLFIFDNFFSAFDEADQAGLLSDEVLRECTQGSAYENVLECWEHSSGETLQRLLYPDIKTYLVELLMKQDNMSMAASIESRAPFLDHPLVEFATNIPQELQVGGLAGKHVLEERHGKPTAAFDSVPSETGLHALEAGRWKGRS